MTEAEARRALLKALHTTPKNFYEFLQRTFKGFQVSRTGFQYQLAMKLEEFYRRCERRESPRLLISMPPRHGKSECASIRFPAYCFGRNPNIQIIHSSYAAELSNLFSGKVRAFMAEDMYRACFPEIKLGRERAALNYWTLNPPYKGSFSSVGIGGAITGKGADIALVDDPVKNSEEADSPTIRAKHADWWASTLYTRLEQGGGILLIMTRWHVEDLGGLVLGSGEFVASEPWETFVLPAIALEGDPLGRAVGEPLWPEKYDAERLEVYRKTMPERWWQALYQQDPVQPGGNQLNVDRIRHGTIDLGTLKVYQGVDLAISTKESADYTVIATIGVDDSNNLYLLEIERVRLGFNDTLNLIHQKAREWRPVQIGIETVAYQTAAFEEANRRWMLPIKAVKPDKDKATRAKLFESRIDADTVFADKRAEWWPVFAKEARAFPQSPHDDQVDAVVNALMCATTIKWWEDRDTREFLKQRQHGKLQIAQYIPEGMRIPPLMTR